MKNNSRGGYCPPTMKKRFMCLLVTMAMLLTLMPVTIYAETGGTYHDTMIWTLDDDGVLTVNGTGVISHYYNEDDPLPWAESKSSITQLILGEGITGIEGDKTFGNMESLRSVTFPDNLIFIGNDAFMNCTALTSVTIPKNARLGNVPFCACTALTEINVNEENPYYASIDGVLCSKDKTELIQYPSGKSEATYTFPESITSIGDEAFKMNDNLTSIVIPDRIKSIGFYAFAYCENLADITIGSGIEEIGYNAFGYTAYESDEANWDGGVLYIGDCLISVNNEISGEYEIKNGTRLISHSAFEYCKSLTGVAIPDSVQVICDDAFADSGLTNATIPKGVTKMGEGVFYGCELTEINVDAENTVYMSENGIVLSRDKTELVCYPKNKADTSYVIPDGVRKIGRNTFTECANLTDVTIPDSVTEIGDYAFNWSRITSIVIPDSVKKIGNGAFGTCTAMTSAVIGDGVEEIDSSAFCFCLNLASVTIGSGVKRIGNSVFSGCDKLTDIYYNGTQEDWEKIVISRQNDELVKATKHYEPTVTPTATPTPEPTDRVEFERTGDTVSARLIFEKTTPPDEGDIQMMAAYFENGTLKRLVIPEINGMTADFSYMDYDISVYVWDKNMKPLMSVQHYK
ncbi:MAG: leucine-rich repeat domain-containing protein [Clostridia bacterium]|nr:leucine-rich repeat domain-containing protein [Clostridia bacterium]MCI9085352.1 leucine-rich repeat domain-containing protein [Clostridia bacterium]